MVGDSDPTRQPPEAETVTAAESNKAAAGEASNSPVAASSPSSAQSAAASGSEEAENKEAANEEAAAGSDAAGAAPPETSPSQPTSTASESAPPLVPPDSPLVSLPPKFPEAAEQALAESAEPPEPAESNAAPAEAAPESPSEVQAETAAETVPAAAADPVSSLPAPRPPASITPKEPPPPAQESSAPAETSTVPGLPEPSAEGESAEAAEAAAAAVEELEEPDQHYAGLAEPSEGDLCRGVIVSLSAPGVFVDFGGKTEGVVPLAELEDDAGAPRFSPGDEIPVVLVRWGEGGDYAALSYRRARHWEVWERLETAYRTEEPIEGTGVAKVKGGLQVDVGIAAFLPGSQADIHPRFEIDSLVGATFPVRVVKLSKSRENVVVSRRALLEEELQALKKKTLASIQEGAIVAGTVKNITDYGVFIDLGGIDGLIHVTDISYGRIAHPSQVLKPGQEVQAKVMKFDPARERVSLSIKHLQPDPWEGIGERYQQGARVQGRVVSVTDYGVFVELESGVEGLVHISETSWSRRPKHPSKRFAADQSVEALTLAVDAPKRRISLSVRQLTPDPWANLAERYRLGDVVEGRVLSLAAYGAFVEVEEGVDGLIHISDLHWGAPPKHPREVLQKGQRMRTVVLRIDMGQRRLSLGVKQLQPDAWESFLINHTAGEIVSGKVARRTQFGCFVELAPGVEGLCHRSEIPRNSGKRNEGLQLNRSYDFKIVRLDEFERRIGLSRIGLPGPETAGPSDAAEESAAPSKS